MMKQLTNSGINENGDKSLAPQFHVRYSFSTPRTQ